MGDWYLGNDDQWHYDKDAPTPGATPPPTSMLPVVAPSPTPRDRTVRYDEFEDHRLEQDDLSAYDREAGIVNTEKIGPLDEVLIQPPQDPEWRP